MHDDNLPLRLKNVLGMVVNFHCFLVDGYGKLVDCYHKPGIIEIGILLPCKKVEYA